MLHEVHHTQAAGATLRLDQVGGAFVLCDATGGVTGSSPGGRVLLERAGNRHALPVELWGSLVAQPVGNAVQWRSPDDEALVLGCTRYAIERAGWLLVMSEISQKRTQLVRRMDQHRREALGSVVATTAHDLRSPLSTIFFNSELLVERVSALPQERLAEIAVDLKEAATQLRVTIDCLLDYVHIGPPMACSVSISAALTRTHSLLRPLLRGDGRRVVVEPSDAPDLVVGNPLAIEQIFRNVIVNSVEAGARTVRVSRERAGSKLRVLIEDDGRGIDPDHQLLVFEPFFTTKSDGTGIGLTVAREAARSARGELELVHGEQGASFAVSLLLAPEVAA